MTAAQFKVVSFTAMLTFALVAYPAFMFYRFVTSELVEVIKFIAGLAV